MNFDFRSNSGLATRLLADLPRTSLARHDAPPDGAPARTRIWDLHGTLHCSIIGTCLSAAELRQIMARAGLGRPDMPDHDLHIEGVRAASRRDAVGKILHKALDQRHRSAIRRAGVAKTTGELAACWQDAVQQGEIPGIYWAVLTHPAATEALIKRVFGEVHMLSHLVGAANRADIRRLSQLEAENAALGEKLRRQQMQLHQAILSRDATIRDLRDSLMARVSAAQQCALPQDNGTLVNVLEKCAADLEARLGAEARRHEALQRRHAQAQETLAQEAAARRAAEACAAALANELRALEAALMPPATALPAADAPARPTLANVTILYVGGRPNQIAGLRALTRRLDGQFLHHDGGIEESGSLMAGLIGRADLVVFPVDCISHDACLAVKRLCRQQGRPFMPLRSSGASSLLAALTSPDLFGRAIRQAPPA